MHANVKNAALQVKTQYAELKQSKLKAEIKCAKANQIVNTQMQKVEETKKYKF